MGKNISCIWLLFTAKVQTGFEGGGGGNFRVQQMLGDNDLNFQKNLEHIRAKPTLLKMYIKKDTGHILSCVLVEGQSLVCVIGESIATLFGQQIN